MGWALLLFYENTFAPAETNDIDVAAGVSWRYKLGQVEAAGSAEIGEFDWAIAFIRLGLADFWRAKASATDLHERRWPIGARPSALSLD